MVDADAVAEEEREVPSEQSSVNRKDIERPTLNIEVKRRCFFNPTSFQTAGRVLGRSPQCCG